jgi:tRNA(Ile)-lysidine synthase
MNLFRKLPKDIGVAFSGGIDSSVLLDVVLRLNKKVTILTFDHSNEQSEKEVYHAIEMKHLYGLPIHIEASREQPKMGDSKEAFWSKQRNEWFNSLDMPVVTGHNLNDVAEWYLMTAAIGKGGQYINYSNKNVYRPLIITPRVVIEEYVKKHKLNVIIDESNNDTKFAKRNLVRAELLPKILEINSGFLTNVIKREINKEFKILIDDMKN